MKLEWKSRFNIALGTAQGLAHLHTKLEAHLVHSDIKATNILLDKNLSPKIADLGLARLFQRDADKLHTFVAGARYKKKFPWFKRMDPWLSPHSVSIQAWAPLSGFKDLMGIIPSYLFCCKFGAAFLACVCIEQCCNGYQLYWYWIFFENFIPAWYLLGSKAGSGTRLVFTSCPYQAGTDMRLELPQVISVWLMIWHWDQYQSR